MFCLLFFDFSVTVLSVFSGFFLRFALFYDFLLLFVWIIWDRELKFNVGLSLFLRRVKRLLLSGSIVHVLRSSLIAAEV
jgi:hypothetical protein